MMGRPENHANYPNLSASQQSVQPTGWILTKSAITLVEQAEVAYLLNINKFSNTTGQIISMDGGLHEAFMR